MALLQFKRRGKEKVLSENLKPFLRNYSIEVMPQTASAIDDFRAILPEGTRVYIAHIDGTPIDRMVATAARLAREGFDVMPHLPARSILSRAELEDWINRYQQEARVTQALVLGGGIKDPRGEFDSSMQLLETGLFDKYGFNRIHVAGHPEGNRDIDPGDSDENLMQALRWKQDFSNRTDADVAIVTQFCFDAKPVISWVNRLKAERIDLPVHIGMAGPAKLQTLIKYAISCGVGPSLKVLQKRAIDVSKLMLPYDPIDYVAELAAHKATNPEFGIEAVHFFPLGGIQKTAEWAIEHGGPDASPAAVPGSE